MASWSREDTLELINKYREKSLLWDPQNKHHFNKTLRNDAWVEIASQMKIRTADSCKKKMTSILAALRREKSKMKKSMGAGKGADYVYRSTWFAFESLQFIWDRNKPFETAETIDNCQQPDAAQENKEDNESLVAEPVEDSTLLPLPGSTSSKKCIPPRKKAMKRSIEDERIDTAFNLLQSCASSNSLDTSDECSDFGNLVAKKLRAYDRVKRSATMHTILGIFLKTDMMIENMQEKNQQVYLVNYSASNTSTPDTSAPVTPLSIDMTMENTQVNAKSSNVQ